MPRLPNIKNTSRFYITTWSFRQHQKIRTSIYGYNRIIHLQRRYRYIVTMMDRKAGWPEAYPVGDITAETIADIIYSG